MLQIRSRVPQTLDTVDKVPASAPPERRASVDLESDFFVIDDSVVNEVEEAATKKENSPKYSEAIDHEKVGCILSYFILNENHIRKLFQVRRGFDLYSLCRLCHLTLIQTYVE